MVIVGGQMVGPGGKLEVIDYPHGVTCPGDIVHQVVETNVAMVNAIHPQLVMT